MHADTLSACMHFYYAPEHGIWKRQHVMMRKPRCSSSWSSNAAALCTLNSLYGVGILLVNRIHKVRFR
jgi:hypothetical protein